VSDSIPDGAVLLCCLSACVVLYLSFFIFSSRLYRMYESIVK
jgi:hypothetical protein